MRRGILLGLLIILLVGLAGASRTRQTPEDVIATLHAAISDAEEAGNYRCCIEPACTMCYLGHWKFDRGTCYCDDAIAEGRDEDVCPECSKALESGACSSRDGKT